MDMIPTNNVHLNMKVMDMIPTNNVHLNVK